jgi:hypothetical protein
MLTRQEGRRNVLGSRSSRTSRTSTIYVSRRYSPVSPLRSKTKSKSRSKSIKIERRSIGPVSVERGRGAVVHRAKSIAPRSQYAMTTYTRSKAPRMTANMTKIAPTRAKIASPTRRSVVFVEE